MKLIKLAAFVKPVGSLLPEAKSQEIYVNPESISFIHAEGKYTVINFSSGGQGAHRSVKVKMSVEDSLKTLQD